jgi:hypothetical protein
VASVSAQLRAESTRCLLRLPLMLGEVIEVSGSNLSHRSCDRLAVIGAGSRVTIGSGGMAEVDSETNGGKAGLQLPAQVTLARTSPGGPVARGAFDAGHAQVSLVNGTGTTITVARVFVTPLADARTGLAPIRADTTLFAGVDKSELLPGEATTIEITGTAPARPGTYTAQLEVITEDGKTAVTPVSITVAANAGWGIACMLLGLLLLGVVKLLTGEGDVQEKKREVLRTRADIHALLQRNPPPQRRLEAVAEIDRNLDEAVRDLARPHPLSVVDRRIGDANAALSAARDDFAKLQDALSKIPPGTAEVADLSEDWSGLQERMKDLATLGNAAAAPASGLTAHAATLLHRVWERVISLPLQSVAADLGPQLERVRLAEAAGETDRARTMALATRAWLRRAADDLDRRLTTMMGLNLIIGRMVVSDAWVRRLAAGDELPPERRSALLDRLAAADAGLAAGATLEDLSAASRAVEDTETEAYRYLNEALKTRVQAAAEVAAAEMSAEPMDAAMANLRTIPHPSTEQKAAALTRMLEVWRGRLGVVQDSEARTHMATEIDTAEAAAQRADLSATMEAVHALEQDWQAYLPRHIAQAGAVAIAATCRDWRDRNLQLLVETSDYVKLQSGRPEIVDWEQRLDRARRGLSAVLPEAAKSPDECLGPVVENGREVIAVSQEVFTTELGDVPIPPKARLDAAENSGVAAAIALSQRLMAEPRDLKLAPQTPEEDRIAGRPIIFVLAGLDPDWGSGVSVMVDWDDGTAPRQTDAEKLRQGDRLEHSYNEVLTVHPVAVAADRFLPAPPNVVPRADGPELGHSVAEVFVHPSPATAAERLADIFLTAQFGLALLIASVVYFWRYHAGARVFGTRGFDYVEAFALGFAAYAAVADLPKVLSELPFK